jgi:NDP-sugar pyrophosphorylase family protein
VDRVPSDSPAVILCGGRGTRLAGALPAGVPKALAETGRGPFLCLLLDRLARQGWSRVVLCTGHLGEAVRRSVGDVRAGVQVSYSDEGDARLGTGGALVAAAPMIAGRALVLNGDTWCALDWRAFMALSEGKRADVLTAVDAGGKPVGAWAVSARVLRYFVRPDFRGSLEELTEVVSQTGRAQVLLHPTDELWYDVGTPESLEAFRERARRGLPG